MKTLLILTGPQGSGNHLFSKIFSLTPGVFGWSELNNQYWVPHDQEPFAEAWHDPALLKTIEFGQYAVTSISCPYAYKGTTTTPDYASFIQAAKDLDYTVKLAVIGRDGTVLKHQQQRVRRTYSYPIFQDQLPQLMSYNPMFLSTELLYLYGGNYVKSISEQLNFPIEISDEKLREILILDPNAKYFTAADEQPLDAVVRTVSGIK